MPTGYPGSGKGGHKRQKAAKAAMAKAGPVGGVSHGAADLCDAPGAGKEIVDPIPYQTYIVHIDRGSIDRETIMFSAVAYPEQILLNYSKKNPGKRIEVYCVKITRELKSA